MRLHCSSASASASASAASQQCPLQARQGLYEHQLRSHQEEQLIAMQLHAASPVGASELAR